MSGPPPVCNSQKSAILNYDSYEDYLPFVSFHRRKIRLIEGNAKCRRHSHREGGGGRVDPCGEKVRGATVHKAGS